MMTMMMVMYRRIPVIRRYTGGGTVVVDKNTAFVTLIMNVMIAINSYNHDDDDDDRLCPFHLPWIVQGCSMSTLSSRNHEVDHRSVLPTSLHLPSPEESSFQPGIIQYRP